MKNETQPKVSHTPETFKVIGETVRELPEVDHGFFSFLGSNIIIHQIGLTKEQCEANTHLIASAPALLKENQELKAERDYWLDQAKNHTVNAELLEALEKLLMAAEYSRYIQKSAGLELSMITAKVLINKAKAQ